MGDINKSVLYSYQVSTREQLDGNLCGWTAQGVHGTDNNAKGALAKDPQLHNTAACQVTTQHSTT